MKKQILLAVILGFGACCVGVPSEVFAATRESRQVDPDAVKAKVASLESLKAEVESLKEAAANGDPEAASKLTELGSELAELVAEVQEDIQTLESAGVDLESVGISVDVIEEAAQFVEESGFETPAGDETQSEQGAATEEGSSESGDGSTDDAYTGEFDVMDKLFEEAAETSAAEGASSNQPGSGGVATEDDPQDE